MWTSALGLGAVGWGEVVSGPLGGDCWVACSNSAIFWSKDWACSAMAAGVCRGATGAGFRRTSKMATNEATRVAMLMMRSSLSFMAILERLKLHRIGIA